MAYSKNYKSRILANGIFIIFLSLTINNKNNIVKAAATHYFGYTHEQVNEQCKKICETYSCVKEATHYLTIMNQNVDPCDDFYEFVCGNFLKDKVIIDQAMVINTFSIAQTQVSNEIYTEITEEIRPDELRAFKKVKIYYQNCMDQSRIEKEGTKPLFDILNKIGGWPVLQSNWNERGFDWRDTIYKIKDQNFLIFFPVISIADIDNKNSTNNIIKIHNADTTISRTFLLDGPNNNLLKAYYNYMINITVMLGANKEVAVDEMKKVLDFEINLHNIETPAEELLNISETDNQITIGELTIKHPSIPWLALLNKIFNPSGVFIDTSEVVHVADPKFISEVEKLIKMTPKRVLANYLAWKVVHSTQMYMPDKLRKVVSDFTNVMEGTKKRMNRESWCLNEIMEAFPISISAMYIRKFFNSETKADILEIMQNVKDQTRKNLEQVDWMDNSTRKAALEKLQAMGVSVGYAAELMDDRKVDEYYSELELNSGIYLNSAFNVTSFLEKQNYKSLRNPVNKNFWTLSPNAAVVNTYYILQRNIIGIPAGYLRSFYRSNVPHYLNYGSVGTTIGHEITHGFDSKGRKYDKYGNQHNWWQADTEKKFFHKARCIIDQYNNFTVAEVGLKVNGIVTQSENIADNGGFKSAYHAYNEWTTRHNISEPCLPFLNYTQRQMFWISAANNWCSKQRPEYLKYLISTDEHSPESARVIISFSNIKEFADDFGCKVGSKMNPEKKCVIW